MRAGRRLRAIHGKYITRRVAVELIDARLQTRGKSDMPIQEAQPAEDVLGCCRQYIHDLATSARELSALDTSAVSDRILQELGWNPIDSRAVSRRFDPEADRILLLLSTRGQPKISLSVFPLRKKLTLRAPEQLPRTPKTEWVAATNGLEWKIWKASAPDLPFREIVLGRNESCKELTAYFGRDAHSGDAVSKIWSDETLGTLITATLRKHLAGSEDLIALLKKTLKREEHVNAEGEDILECLKRLDVRITPADENSVPELLLQLPSPEVQPDGAAPAQSATPPARTRGPATPYSRARMRNSSAPEPESWPKGATHMLYRKGHAAFIRYTPQTGKTVLLPGSVMRSKTKSSFPTHSKKLREQALSGGAFVQEGEVIRVVEPLTVDTPSTAATLVAGTVSNGWTSWRNRDGTLIRRPSGSPNTRDSSSARGESGELAAQT